MVLLNTQPYFKKPRSRKRNSATCTNTNFKYIFIVPTLHGFNGPLGIYKPGSYWLTFNIDKII